MRRTILPWCLQDWPVWSWGNMKSPGDTTGELSVCSQKDRWHGRYRAAQLNSSVWAYTTLMSDVVDYEWCPSISSIGRFWSVSFIFYCVLYSECPSSGGSTIQLFVTHLTSSKLHVQICQPSLISPVPNSILYWIEWGGDIIKSVAMGNNKIHNVAMGKSWLIWRILKSLRECAVFVL